MIFKKAAGLSGFSKNYVCKFYTTGVSLSKLQNDDL